MASVRFPARQRRWPVIAIVAVVVLAVLFTVASQFYVDLLWFREVGQSEVFWIALRTKLLLGLVFGLLFFGLLYVNLLIVQRLAPTTRILTPDQEIVERIRQGFEPYLRWLLPAASGLLALLVGVGVARQWQTFLLWRHSAGAVFGSPEAQFGRDPAFYVFSLPWLEFLQGWLFSSLAGVTFLVAIAHFLWGGIRPQAPALADKVEPATRAHLSVLLGLIMLSKAWGYYLGRFDLLSSRRGVVQGASYTDVNAQLPALTFLMIAALICAVLFLINIRVRLWSLPLIAVGLLAIVSVLLGTAYPAFVQKFRVEPQEVQKESEFIERNIAGTKRAFGLDAIGLSEHAVQPEVTAKALKRDEVTIANIRLWRTGVLGENFQSLQQIRQYYVFHDVDVDRYQLGSDRRVLMVAAREVSQGEIPLEGRTWQTEHLVYTHGFGAVAAQVNSATTEGAPVFTLKDIPAEGEPFPVQPRIYYGEGGPLDASFVVVNTNTAELDFQGAPEPFSYTGDGGIELGNILKRALFAWRFRDVNLLISGQIDSQSKIMIYRSLVERVPKPVPFLTFDFDPYLAVTDDGMKWIWDAYTTTDAYPYSQAIDVEEATDGLLTAGDLNYIRNSVKVVVDAYDGTMTYYADLSEPIIQVWAAAFPGLFTPIEQAPPDLIEHFRYPENLFQIQASQFANYHVTDPSTFYNRQDFWEIPDDPTDGGTGASTSATVTPTAPVSAAKLRPYYVLMKVPGDDTERFYLVLPFVPDGRPNMVSWMAANSDPEGYGSITAFTFPTGRNIEGPSQVFARINQNPSFSSERTLLGQGGSDVLFGDFLVIPFGDSFLYVQPVYVRSDQTSAVPELKRVVVVNGDTVGVGTTLTEALAETVEGQVPGGGPSEPPQGSVDEQVAALLQEALEHFAAADEALRAGNLAGYEAELTLAQDLVAQAEALVAQQAGGGTEPTATPTAPPTVSPTVSPSP